MNLCAFRDLAVEGTLPAALNGVYLRNGPNPFFKPVAGYHWFDGDGLVHATCIKVHQRPCMPMLNSL